MNLAAHSPTLRVDAVDPALAPDPFALADPAAEGAGVAELRLALDQAHRLLEWHSGMLARTEALCRSGSLEIDWPSGAVEPSRGLGELLGLPMAARARMQIDDLAWIPPEERAYVAGFWRHAVVDEPFEFQHRVVCADGRRLVVLHRGVLNSEGHPGARGVAMLQDITAQREAEQRIHDLASSDEVTGLPNRSAVLDRLDAAMHAARWSAAGLALLALEVPLIAEIKAGMGFGAGDTLAMALAARLKDGCGDGESIAQLSDTEFALVIERDGEVVEADLEARARSLLECLRAPVRLGSTEVFAQGMVGIASYPLDADAPGALVEAAQSARLGLQGGGIARYRLEAAAQMRRHMHIEAALRHAVEGDELSLHYQPQVDFGTGAVIGAEALLHWTSAELGVIAPGEFIPIAERSGLIGAIGDWTLHHACAQAAAWHDAGLPALRVAVNLSPAQLQRPDFAQQVREVLQATGASGEQLGIELTESMLMADFERASAVLRAVKGLGVKVSLDDFGTGYSSLNSLSRLPIDVVKIDRSFVVDVGTDTRTDAQQASVTRAIINMAHGLHMKVLAEGVETESQLNLLVSQGCDQMQGHWFSAALPADDFAALLREGRRLPAQFLSSHARTRTLLLVDDEDNIVSALKRLLRRDGYQIITACSAAEGLQKLAEHPVDVIVSDQRMPGMTGVEFLHRAKALYPSTVRIVLSGFTELQSIIDAVNEGAIYKFLTKPWDDELLRTHIAEAFAQKELADDNRRLSRQVETANADLATLNDRLERLVTKERAHAEVMVAGANGIRGLLDELPLALFGVDPDGLIAYTNRSGGRVMQRSGATLGRALLDAMPLGPADRLAQDGRLGPEFTIDGARFRVLAHELTHTDPPRGQLLALVPQP
ncbi:MAG: EAL domain-containing protein [Leptothrix sp. (in: b-proteobacteria)]